MTRTCINIRKRWIDEPDKDDANFDHSFRTGQVLRLGYGRYGPGSLWKSFDSGREREDWTRHVQICALKVKERHAKAEGSIAKSYVSAIHC
jgi:hypothetical protein